MIKVTKKCTNLSDVFKVARKSIPTSIWLIIEITIKNKITINKVDKIAYPPLGVMRQ